MCAFLLTHVGVQKDGRRVRPLANPHRQPVWAPKPARIGHAKVPGINDDRGIQGGGQRGRSKRVVPGQKLTEAAKQPHLASEDGLYACLALHVTQTRVSHDARDLLPLNLTPPTDRQTSFNGGRGFGGKE